MNTPYLLILDEYGYYAPNLSNVFSGRAKRSIAKRIDIQQRWDNRCQKRKLNATVGFEGTTPQARKI